MSSPTAPRRLPLLETLESRQFLSAGQLDPTFGDGGKLLTDAGLAYGTNVAVQADGKILATATSDAFRDFNLIRYNPDGSLDTTFGDGGVVSSNFPGTHSDFIDSMTVKPDGKIVVAGRTNGDNGSATLVVRYNADGSLDTSFSDDGMVTLPGDTYDPSGPLRVGFSPGRALIAAQADGKLVLTQVRGDDGSATGGDLVVIRLTDTGALDTTFGTGGKATVELGSIETPADLALQADGRIVVAVDAFTVTTSGDSTSYLRNQAHLVRLNADGSLDTTFGTNGVATINPTLQQVTATRIAIALDGHVLLMAEDFNAGGAVQHFIARFNTDGSLDTAFGTAGRVNLSADATYANILVQPDGKLLLTGGGMGGGNHPALFSQRRNADGALDTDYGDGGTTRVEVGPSFDFARASALQQDGSVVVIGFSNKVDPSEEHDGADVALLRHTGDAGAAGSRHFALRRGIDQHIEYSGRTTPHHHRSPKRRAMEAAARAAAAQGKKPRSPKRRAMDEARQAAAAAASAPKALVFNANRAIVADDDDRLSLLA
jgi:uncharacterized delta-60 repeat protein